MPQTIAVTFEINMLYNILVLVGKFSVLKNDLLVNFT